MKQEQHELDKKALIESIFDSLHLITIHYGIWFRETEHQLGLDKAIEADDIAWKRILPLILDRVTKRLKIPTEDNIPESLTNATKEDLVELLADMGKNWLTTDGSWFQAVEQNFDYEMYNAKRINDSCWARFSYIEAKRIMKRLDLPENGGLTALREALKPPIVKAFGPLSMMFLVIVNGEKAIFIRNCTSLAHLLTVLAVLRSIKGRPN